MLTKRQEAFVHEYLIDLHGTRAAIRAGYAAGSAAVEASRLLSLPHIADAVEHGIEQRLARTNMAADDVLYEMSLLAYSDVEHYRIGDEGEVSLAPGAPVGAVRAIQAIKRRRHVRFDPDGSVTVTHDLELRLWDKIGPLRLLGRHVGLFADRIEVTGPNGGPIETITRVERVIIDLPCGALTLPADTELAGASPARDERSAER